MVCVFNVSLGSSDCMPVCFVSKWKWKTGFLQWALEHPYAGTLGKDSCRQQGNIRPQTEIAVNSVYSVLWGFKPIILHTNSHGWKASYLGLCCSISESMIIVNCCYGRCLITSLWHVKRTSGTRNKQLYCTLSAHLKVFQLCPLYTFC